MPWFDNLGKSRTFGSLGSRTSWVFIEQIVYRVVHRIEQALLRSGYQPFDEREHVLAIQEEHV